MTTDVIKDTKRSRNFTLDAAIERALNEILCGSLTLCGLGLTEEDFTPERIRKIADCWITHIDLSGNNFKDISFIKEFGVSSLTINNSRVKDITPLKFLPDLNSIEISSSGIEDLEPLRGCSKLTQVLFDDCFIRDISPLSSLPKIQYLSIKKNRIVNIEPLSSLVDLEYLSIENNLIKDFTVLGTLPRLTNCKS